MSSTLSLQSTVERIRSLSTLPQVAIRILQRTSDPNSSAKDLEDIIRADPPLAAVLLRMVNSAHFGLRERVLDIRKAIIFLGFRTVRDLALSASVCDIFKSRDQIGTYSRVGLWKHCVGVGVCSKAIAQKLNLDFADNLFSLGILMDLGIIMLDQYLHEEFKNILLHPDFKSLGMSAIQKEVLGFTHMELSEHVGQAWKLPTEALVAMAYQQKPKNSPVEFHSMMSVIFLANTLINAQEFGFVTTSVVEPTAFNFSLAQLGLKKLDVRVILEDLPRELERATEIIQLAEC
ncbi:MAG: HDOD domain-containing protein [Candidatus Cloacimonetes bacterium]|nr:HDOD domain-containing protein [Candidatus Cloacimonadota bacterium]